MRQITKDDICIKCGKESKTSLHLFWFCDRMKEVWSNSKLVFPFCIDSRWSFVDVVWQLVQHRSICPGLMEKVLSLCWEIWKNKNTVCHGVEQHSGKFMVRSLASLVEEY